MLCYLVIFDYGLPSNAEIFNNEFIKILEFKILNPDGIIGLFVPDFKLNDLFEFLKSDT